MIKTDFQVLDNPQYGLFAEFVRRFPSESCERSWANLQLYQDTYNWQYALIDGRLWIGSFEAGYIFYPLGEDIPPQELQTALLSFAGCCHGECVCGDIPDCYMEKFPDSISFLPDLQRDIGDADYIYDLKHLHSFSGSKLRKRHNQVRQFEREYANNFSVESLTADNLPEVQALAAELSGGYWDSESGLEEKFAVERLADLLFDKNSDLDGVLLKVSGKAAAFSVFSTLDTSLADVHFEKADHSLRGCGAKITAVLAEYLLEKGFSFMNREQDLGEEGLRRAKQALDPDHLHYRLSVKIRS